MATGTYKKTTNTVATYGENSPSVLALQKELNTKYNAGLKEDSRYGDVTKAAYEKYMGSTTGGGAGTGAGVGSSGGTSSNLGSGNPDDTARYVRTANKNDTDISRLERELSDSRTEAPSLEKIREEKMAGARGVIDAITAQFSKTLADQGVMNSGLNDRVRALNVGAGLGGSDFATAAAVGQEKKNAKAIQLIEQERDAKINEILTGVDSRADEAYRQQREEYVKGLGEDLAAKKAARDEDRTRAKESIAGLAAQGVALDKLKTVDPKTYETLLKEYGGSPLDLETAWNASLPEKMKTQYDQKTIRGTNGNAVILRYGFNPMTGKTESKEYDMEIPYEKLADSKSEVKELDGRLWQISTDANGATVAKPLTEISALTQSMINENNASAEKSRNDANNPAGSFKFTGSQKSKLFSADFNEAKISAVEKDLREYGVKAVLDGFSSEEERAALKDALAGSSLAQEIAAYMKEN